MMRICLVMFAVFFERFHALHERIKSKLVFFGCFDVINDVQVNREEKRCVLMYDPVKFR